MGITCWILDCISIRSLPHFLKTSHGHEWCIDSDGDSLLDSWLYFNILCLFLTFWKLVIVMIDIVIGILYWILDCISVYCVFLTFWKLVMVMIDTVIVMGILYWILDCISIHCVSSSLSENWSWSPIHTVIALWHFVCTFCTVLFAPWSFSDCDTSCIPSYFSDRSHQYDWIPKRNVVTVVPSRN